MITIIIFIYLKQILSDKLISVFSLDRHGVRSPASLYPNNTDFFGNLWESPGILTGNGERMFYILGMYKRYKYMNEINFIDEKCKQQEILFGSSNMERTIMSALSEIQGLCPSNKSNGKNIDLNYTNYTYPPIQFFENMKTEIDNLNTINSSFPNSLVLLPINIYHSSERKIMVTLYGCDSTQDIIKSNLNNPNILNIVKEFNNKYYENLKGILKEEEKNDFQTLFGITDQYISSFYDGKNPEKKLLEIGIDPEEFLNISNKFHEVFMNDYLFGDKNQDIIFVDSSLLIRDAVNYMKKRVDADINNEDTSTKLNDYSRPKLVVVAGHDSSIVAFQFLIKIIFNLTDVQILDISYGENIVFEVYKNNETKDKYNYSDYYVNYLINDVIIKTFKFDNFVNVIETKTWDNEKVNKFCNPSNNDNVNLSSSMKIVVIILIIIIFLLLIIVFLLVLKNIHDKKLSGLIEDANSIGLAEMQK